MREQISILRQEMKKNGIDWYMVVTADYHNSEYVSDYFKCREWLSGFTGSNGTLLVSSDVAYLWTDGRYFVQAGIELENTGIKLMKMGEENVPKIKEYLEKHMKPGEVLGFDGRTCNADYINSIYEFIGRDKTLKYDLDLCEKIWKDRPAINCSKAYVIGTEFTGESYLNKIKRVRDYLDKYNCQYLFLSKLDDIMWLFNIRGEDVEYNPVVLSYACISKDDCYLFIQNEAVSEEFALYAKINNIVLKDYNEVYSFLEDSFREDKNFNTVDSVEPNICADLKQINYCVYGLLKGKTNIVDSVNPTTLFKAVKNATEIENMKEFFLLDSVAVCRFLYKLDMRVKAHERGEYPGDYLKDENGDILSEKSAERLIDELRSQIPGFKGLSFTTISAYGSNGAMMHYEAGDDGGALLKNEGFLLVDSGGQYLGATTDVTRTIVLGDISDEQKRDFTLVLKGMLNLMNTQFIKGCTGRNLDIIARAPLWKMGMDYKCGTGHGVGCFLNVHEGPHSIRWRYIENSHETELEPGMVVTDEPGVYKEGRYGIRTENTLLIVEGDKTEDGSFLRFEPLTLVPIDLRAVDLSLLEREDIRQLRDYQSLVIDSLSPHLTDEEAKWLKGFLITENL
ncbi:MAG: aminopeptidase P family protein [Lachnospiraceae bacterium]|nr:aminopeptidase P family protein [Lachnospiraceae bacterium]